ncbi:mucin-2 [Episyrphus balteatus]|uniref:mucin-2 n=1 Tax=Episyrphus balteatus TaxID=286459 RepID=UPI0024852E54|nr:mucin-2 [Episyrphus balteatus]XP_055837543.1 mucin-2 [Episyrphus balteatus]
MNLKIQLLTACLWLIVQSASTADKWSRQLDEIGPGTETYDWIPVAQPVDAKERAGRVITYQQNFPPNAAFGEIQKPHHVSPAQQQVQPFGFPFHFQRFPQPQTQQLQHNQPQPHHQQPIQQQKLNLPPQQPTSQSFFKFEMPFNRDGNRNQDSSQGVQTGYQIQHSNFGAPAQSLFHSPLFTQKQVFPPEFHPVPRPQSLLQQASKPVQQNFIDEPIKQSFREPIPTHSSVSSTSAPPTAFPFQHNFELQKPASFQSQAPFQAAPLSAPAPTPVNTQQDQEVQLLYVPYDTLYNQQRNENSAFENSKFNQEPNVQQVNPYQINDFYTPETLQPQDPNRFIGSTTLRTTTTTLKPTTPFQNYFNQQFTTPKPKPKAHQPPLAMFLLKSSSRPTQSDVVNALRNAKTIAVLDAPTSQAPTVFVGPAGMQTPNGYAKFELPYLSQIAQNSNIGDTSFFVAPLSYRTPAGFNKILLPEPHVGSIVVNRQRETYNDVRGTNQPAPQYSSRPSPIPQNENYPQSQPQYENYNNARGSNKPSLQQSDLYNNERPSNQRTQQPLRENYNNVRGSNQSPTQQPQRENYNNVRGSNQGSPNQNVFITPSQNEIQQFPSTTQRNRPETTQRIKATTMREYYPEIVRDVPKPERNRYPYEVTTQRQPTAPSRGHKFSEISTQKNYYQEAIQEVTSPKIYKQERIKQKRPDSQYSDNPRPYANFKPIPNNIPAEDFYKVQPIKTSPTTTSTTSTTTTTTSTSPPRTYFTQTYPTSPQIDFQSTRGQVYHGPEGNTGGDRFTTRPSSQQQQEPQQVSDEEYRMKQYYRQQEAFRNRPTYPSTTPSRPTVESVPYTPVSVDYDREVRIPSSTPNYYTTTTTTPRPVTQRQRVTFYHPTTTPTYEENSNTVPPSEPVFEFSRDRDVQTTPPQQEEKTQVPDNHRPTFTNSNLNNNNNNNEISTQDGSEVEYEPNPYQLPSELPPLTPNLPGLVNGLIDKERQNASEGETTVQMESTTKPTTPIRPSRRPINRVKKPVVSKVSQSVSYSSSDYSTRRPLNRTRRPYAGRNYTTSATSTTERSSTTRSPLIRNPNRIRYNPTPEERQSLRIKNRKNASGGKKDDNSDDLEYQRDVLKQNYPVFKPATRRTTTTPGPISTDRPVSESQQVFTVTPSSEQNYDGLIEPMQIAQQYQEYPQTNYGPGYFPNEEDTVPTEAVLRNEISPIYSSTTTTEEPQATTRRTPFIRRGPRIRTTTETPTTNAAPTTAPSEERYTVRTRAPPRRVVKVRARTRRPHPASSTSTAAPEESEDEPEPSKGNNFNRLNRFNQDLYQDEMAQRRQRIKSQFHLEPQESQWSPSLSGKSINNFQPLTQKNEKPVQKTFENEPEIVTANPDAGKSDSYVFNVSAGFGPTANTHFSSKIEDAKSSNNSKKSEKSFADLLEEVMSDIGKVSDAKSTDSAYFESQKMDTHLNRKAKWKTNNASAAESFETAESQNIGTQFFNSLYTGKMEKSTASHPDEVVSTTSAKVEPIATTTIPTVVATELESDMITINPEPEPEIMTESLEESEEPLPTTSLENMPLDTEPESITRRVDDLWNVEDLDTQPSVFSEVRKQLNELFKPDENEDDEDEEIKDFVQPPKYEYKSIHRVRTTSESTPISDASALTETPQNGNANVFHKNLMESVVYATSTSTKEEAPETEICYRGRCIRSEDLPSNHKLH